MIINEKMITNEEMIISEYKPEMFEIAEHGMNLQLEIKEVKNQLIDILSKESSQHFKNYLNKSDLMKARTDIQKMYKTRKASNLKHGTNDHNTSKHCNRSSLHRQKPKQRSINHRNNTIHHSNHNSKLYEYSDAMSHIHTKLDMIAPAINNNMKEFINFSPEKDIECDQPFKFEKSRIHSTRRYHPSPSVYNYGNIDDMSIISEDSVVPKTLKAQLSSRNIHENVIFNSTLNYPLHSTLNGLETSEILSEVNSKNNNTFVIDNNDNNVNSNKNNVNFLSRENENIVVIQKEKAYKSILNETKTNPCLKSNVLMSCVPRIFQSRKVKSKKRDISVYISSSMTNENKTKKRTLKRKLGNESKREFLEILGYL